MKQIKFITTFSKNGYYVYGKQWIESFLEFTKAYDNIVAKIYVNDMDIAELNYDDKVEIVDFDIAIPHHKQWAKYFLKKSTHPKWSKDLAVKFSFKSFVMIDVLKNNTDDCVIWLDADSIFKSYDFDNFVETALQDNFIACQKEADSEHIESGIVIFDTAHTDKEKFISKFESFYQNAEEFNSFGQFYDGYAIHRALTVANIVYTDLNKGYGIKGIQSDPSCTFLNPLIQKRFHHNIGIAGKRNYENWEDYAKQDKFFQMIHGVNDIPIEIQIKENISKINNKIDKLRRR